jgi:TRAP-type mannitol/chloroaromatic compound transport system substrate-binding protein
LTYPFEDWAKDMKDLTDGRWEIEVHYGGVLAPGKEGIDGLKAGMFEAVLYTSMYGPGKLPLSTVMQLPFMGPPTVLMTGEWFMAVQAPPALKKEVDQWNAQILFPTPLRQYNHMGTVKITKAEDFNGVRVRIDPVAGKPLEDYGAVLTMMPAGDIYTALERGMLDSVLWQWTYTFGAY